jgi:uncharacterized cupredoxin-like copper-binding protein
MTRISMALSGLALLGMTASAGAFAATMSSVNVSLTGEGTGKMAIAVDQASIKAGRVTFVVKNDAIGEKHEFVVLKLAKPGAALPYDPAKDKVIESKAKKLGEVEDVAPGDTKNLMLDLKPGSYQLICNIKGHYMAGMSALLTVTK